MEGSRRGDAMAAIVVSIDRRLSVPHAETVNVSIVTTAVTPMARDSAILMTTPANAR